MIRKPKAYIAGPMTGYVNYNFDSFDAAAEKLRKLGYQVINPADLDRAVYHCGKYMSKELQDIDMDEMVEIIRRDINIILGFRKERGDIIYFLNNWSRSKGARFESAAADYVDIQRYFDFEIEHTPPVVHTRRPGNRPNPGGGRQCA